MLAIVARWGTLKVATPGPKYSTTQPTLPLVVRMLSSLSATSLAAHHGASSPVSRTPMTRGYASVKGLPAIASATSSPPAPMANMPMPPPVGVCESEPSSVFPGRPKRSRCTWWQMPLPGGEKTTSLPRAMLRRYRWSLRFSGPFCIMLWSTYETETSVRTRDTRIASSSRYAIVPVASCVRV